MINIVGGMIGAMLLPAIQTALTPLMNAIRQDLYQTFPNETLNFQTLMQMRLRQTIPETMFISEAKRSGIEPTLATLALQSQKNWVGAVDLITLWRRKKIEETDLDERLERLAYSPRQIIFLKQITEFFPNAQDLVRFAVREVYTSSVRAKFGMDEDRPNKFLEEAKKAGVMDEEAKNFWAAHWELPGLREGFEMMYRTDFSEEDLDILLKAKDIMPYFRPFLKKIAYQPLTRVDVRRMHDMGVLDDKQVKDAYQHLGYSPENAQNMLDFTILYNTDSERHLSLSILKSAHQRKMITTEQYRGHLEDLGYNVETIDFWIAMSVYDDAEKELMASVASIKSQVRMNILSKENGNYALLALGQPATFTQKIIEEIDREEKERVRLPTKADLLRWLNLAVIGEKTFNSNMRKIGYRSQDVVLYLTENAINTASAQEAAEMKLEDELLDEIVTVKPEKRKFLGIKTYQKWLKLDILTVEDFQNIALEMRVSDEDIGRLIDEAQEE